MKSYILTASLPQCIPPGLPLSDWEGIQYVGSSRALGFNHRVDFVPYTRTVNASGLPIHEDQQIVAAMARGDERAAAQLYDKYSASMYALAMRIVGDGVDAEDVVLDVFTQAWSKATTYEAARGSVLGWMTTMTRTRALDCVRSRGRRTRAVDSASRAMGDEPVGVASASVSAHESVELSERAESVNNAMTVLSAQQRQAIELAFFDGLTHSEISDRLGEPLGTIKTRIRLGMQKLRDVLRESPQGRTS